jgi:hypothetical protein
MVRKISKNHREKFKVSTNVTYSCIYALISQLQSVDMGWNFVVPVFQCHNFEVNPPNCQMSDSWLHKCHYIYIHIYIYCIDPLIYPIAFPSFGASNDSSTQARLPGSSPWSIKYMHLYIYIYLYIIIYIYVYVYMKKKLRNQAINW